MQVLKTLHSNTSSHYPETGEACQSDRPVEHTTAENHESSVDELLTWQTRLVHVRYNGVLLLQPDAYPTQQTLSHALVNQEFFESLRIVIVYCAGI